MSCAENSGRILRCGTIENGFLWELPNYFAHQSKTQLSFISSPWFFSFGAKWRLALIPNGNLEDRHKHVGFFLWKSLPFNRLPHIVVKLGLANLVRRKFHQCYENKLDDYGSTGSWVFLKLNAFENSKEEISPNGLLRFFCQLREETENIKAISHTSSSNISRMSIDDAPFIENDHPNSGISHDNEEEDDDDNENEEDDEDEDMGDEDDENESEKSDFPEAVDLKFYDFDEEDSLEDKLMLKDVSENKGISRLVQDFKKLLLNGHNSDLVLKVKDHEFKVHRGILTVRSPVFASMLQHVTKESTTGVVDIPDCTREAFQALLSYIYSGTADSMSLDNVFDLYYAADKYQINDLKSDCVEFIIRNLSVENFCDVMVLSVQHSESRLQKTATRFFRDNVQSIIKSIQWQRYMKDYTTEANELFIKAIDA